MLCSEVSEASVNDVEDEKGYQKALEGVDCIPRLEANEGHLRNDHGRNYKEKHHPKQSMIKLGLIRFVQEPTVCCKHSEAQEIQS